MAKFESVAFNEDRTYGVEIEFFGVHYRTVVASLKRAGIDVEYEYYNHEVRSRWKLTTDVSVNKLGTGAGKGLELVSPPMSGQEGFAELRTVMQVLTDIGGKVDKSCGMHVHHKAADLGLDGFKNLYSFYHKFENWVDALLPESRRGSYNIYCKGVTTQLWQAVQEATSLQDIHRVAWDRYCKLNFNSYYKYGTVEFRQHSGTLEAEKAIQWVIFSQSMVERSKGDKIRHADEKVSDLDKAERQFRRNMFGDYKAGYLNNDYGMAFKFQTGRRAHFASRVA